MLDDEPRLRAFVEHGPFYAFVKDAQARFLYINPALERASGIALSTLRGSAQTASPATLLTALAREHDARVLQDGETVITVEAVPQPDDSTRHWMIVRFRFAQPDGSRAIGGIAVDVTDLRSGQLRLAESERLYRHLVESAQGLICTHDMDGWLLTVNRAAQTSLGLAADQLIGTNLRDLLTEESRPNFDGYLERIARDGSALGMMLVRAGNGRELAWKYHNVTVREPGKAPYVLGHAQDVSELREAQERLTRLAMTDDLTGLQNRRGFFAAGARSLAESNRHHRATAVIYADIDGLKRVNDTLGHDAGTALILGAADVMKNSFRAADVLARLGGDEFVALAAVSRADADTIVNRLKWHLDKFNATAGLLYPLALSIGMAHMEPDAPKSLEDLVREADAAMYEQKRRLPGRR